MKQVISILSTSYFPEITIFFSKNKINKVTKMLKNLLIYNGFISLITFLLLTFFLKEPFLYWTKGVVEWEFIFFMIFLLSSLIEWVNIPAATFPYAINKHTFLNRLHILSLAIYWIMLVLLFNNFELYAVPIALLISNIYFFIHNLIYINNIDKLNLNLIKIFKKK